MTANSRPPFAVAPQVARNQAIDTIRGLAILMVMLFHFNLTYNLRLSPLKAFLPDAVLRSILECGNYGVTMFFAVSGFLIARNSIVRWGSLRAIVLREFYGLRLARIAPPLLLALALILGFYAAGWPSFANSGGNRFGLSHGAFNTLSIVSVLTFWHNVLLQNVGWYNFPLNIYWSLSVEEAFYLGFPLLALVLGRVRWIILGCAAFVVLGPIYRGAHVGQVAFASAYLSCFDAIALGILAAIVDIKLARTGRTLVKVLAAGMLAVAFGRGVLGNEVFGYTLVAFGTALILPFAPNSANAVPGRAATAPLRWMGSHSYELYLLHMILLAVMRDVLPQNLGGPAMKLVWLAIFVASCSLAALILARCLAQPANRWLRRRVFHRAHPAPECETSPVYSCLSTAESRHDVIHDAQ